MVVPRAVAGPGIPQNLRWSMTSRTGETVARTEITIEMVTRLEARVLRPHYPRYSVAIQWLAQLIRRLHKLRVTQEASNVAHSVAFDFRIAHLEAHGRLNAENKRFDQKTTVERRTLQINLLSDYHRSLPRNGVACHAQLLRLEARVGTCSPVGMLL